MAITALQESRRARGKERELPGRDLAAAPGERPVPASRQPQPQPEQHHPSLDWGAGLFPGAASSGAYAAAGGGLPGMELLGAFSLPGLGGGRGRGSRGGAAAGRGQRGARPRGEGHEDADMDYNPRAGEKGRDGRRGSAEDEASAAADVERDSNRLDEVIKEGILRHGLDFDRVADYVAAARVNTTIKKMAWWIKRQNKRLDFEGLLEQRRQQQQLAAQAAAVGAAAPAAAAGTGPGSAPAAPAAKPHALADAVLVAVAAGPAAGERAAEAAAVAVEPQTAAAAAPAPAAAAAVDQVAAAPAAAEQAQQVSAEPPVAVSTPAKPSQQPDGAAAAAAAVTASTEEAAAPADSGPQDANAEPAQPQQEDTQGHQQLQVQLPPLQPPQPPQPQPPPPQPQIKQQPQEEEEEEAGSPDGPTERAQWTAADRAVFVESIQQLGKQWAAIAERIPGKTPVQCRSFYTNNKEKMGLDELIPKELLQQQRGKPRGRSRGYSSTNLAAAGGSAGGAAGDSAAEAGAAAAAAAGGSNLHSPDAVEIMHAAFAPAAGGHHPHHHHHHHHHHADGGEPADAAAAAAGIAYGAQHVPSAAAALGYDAAAAAAGVSEAEWWALQAEAAMQQRPAPAPHPAKKQRGGGAGGRRAAGKRKQPYAGSHNALHGIDRHPNLAAVLKAAAHLLDEDEDFEEQPGPEAGAYGQYDEGGGQYEQLGYAQEAAGRRGCGVLALGA